MNFRVYFSIKGNICNPPEKMRKKRPWIKRERKNVQSCRKNVQNCRFFEHHRNRFPFLNLTLFLYQTLFLLLPQYNNYIFLFLFQGGWGRPGAIGCESGLAAFVVLYLYCCFGWFVTMKPYGFTARFTIGSFWWVCCNETLRFHGTFVPSTLHRPIRFILYFYFFPV